jgi:hypothetical protein
MFRGLLSMPGRKPARVERTAHSQTHSNDSLGTVNYAQGTGVVPRVICRFPIYLSDRPAISEAMVLSHGFVLDRDAVIASLDDAPPWRNYEISGDRLIEVSEDTAILVYTGRASRGEGAPAFHALMSSVYTRRDGQWRLTLYQQTSVPDADR